MSRLFFFGAIAFVGLGLLVVYALLQIIESIANRNVISAAPHKKSKDIAVVLAALFGPFSWLYVWKDNSWKFWLNLCLIVVTFGGWYIVAWLWAILDMAIKPVGYYENYEINQNPDDRHIKHVNSEVYGEAE